MRLALATLTTVAAVVGVAACRQQTTTGFVPDEEPTQPSSATTKSAPAANDAGTDETCLGKAHLAFDNAACNTCMSDDAACCAATIACFGGDSDCAELHACMTKCGGAGDGGGGGMGNGTGGGNGNGNGMGGGGGDGGAHADGGTNSCQDACKIEHQRAVDRWTTYNTCTIATCKSACL